MDKCPFFEKCGGCNLDFSAPDYKKKKAGIIKSVPTTETPVWLNPGLRRRAEFAFSGGKFGFFEQNTKNIIPINKCLNLGEKINNLLPEIAKLPWGASGTCLITECENGLDVAITANVPFWSTEFKNAALNLPVIRITWNNQIIKQTDKPVITFGKYSVDYPSNAFLQPTIESANLMREMVKKHTNGFNNVADLFCGLGNFTFETNADGFDIIGTGTKRDLFKSPVTVGMLKKYDCVIMDPPRAGAITQCKEIAKSNVKRIIYISCNPNTYMRDRKILESGGYKNTLLIPIDQFVGSTHWELFGIFDK